MPHRYQGHRIPAVIYANTFDYLVGFICILSGLRVVLEPETIPSSIQALPHVLTVSFCAALLLAGTLILFGLAKRYTVDWGTAFERSGMWFAGTCFVTYGAALIFFGPKSSSFLAILIVLAFSAGCGVRALGLGIESRATLATLQSAPRKPPRRGGNA